MLELLLRVAQQPQNPEQFRVETHVLPGLCGLPRIIRAFTVHDRKPSNVSR